MGGTPWRVNLLDIVAAESPVDWTDRPAINPGPFQFHPDPSHVRRWMADKGFLFCRRGEVREIMRPVRIPADPPGWGLCDGIHRDVRVRPGLIRRAPPPLEAARKACLTRPARGPYPAAARPICGHPDYLNSAISLHVDGPGARFPHARSALSATTRIRYS
jgi:hypothetical protein